MILSPEKSNGIVDLVSGVSWSADDLAREVARRAAFLDRFGLGAGDIAVLAHGGTPSFFADLFAVWHRGAGAAVTDPALTPGELRNVARFVDAKAVLVDEGGAEGVDVPVVAPGREAPADAPPLARAEPDEEAPALVLFTSGTTGTPKGVVHSHGSIARRVRLNARHIGAAALARTLTVLPTHFGHGLIGNCLTPLHAGGRLFLHGGMGIRGAAALPGILADCRITFMSSVPAFWKLVLRAARPPAEATLVQVHVGSAPLAAELWRRIADWTGTDNVLNMYGITETANWAAGASLREFAAEDGLVGRMWGGRARVLRDDGSVAEEGAGEILLDTPSLMTGYFRRPDLTAEALTSDGFRTGDVGTIDADGVLRLTGRRKHEINRAGIKIQPEEIDLLLERHPAVVECCAFGIDDRISGETVAAAIRLADGAEIGAKELRQWCSERIRRVSVPEKWFFVAEIPKTDRGKINRERVRDFCLGEEGAA